jgi:hypothetical protein
MVAQNASDGNDAIDAASTAVKFIFSWVILMPIAVIITGKLLALILKLPVQSKQAFYIRVPPLLTLRADNEEVIWGFIGFFVTLVSMGVIFGKSAYALFKDRFGVDPGHFNALCVFSSLTAVVISVALYLLIRGLGRLPRDDIAAEHERLIESLTPRDGEDGK